MRRRQKIVAKMKFFVQKRFKFVQFLIKNDLILHKIKKNIRADRREKNFWGFYEKQQGVPFRFFSALRADRGGACPPPCPPLATPLLI